MVLANTALLKPSYHHAETSLAGFLTVLGKELSTLQVPMKPFILGGGKHSEHAVKNIEKKTLAPR